MERQMAGHQFACGERESYIRPFKTKMKPVLLSQSAWDTRTDAALQWLGRSIDATGKKGSAHSWMPVLGWNKAYPETTGYLIPTLLYFADLKKEDSLRRLALGCADWLCTVQLPNGAFPAGLAGRNDPSIFNSSQILFGFVKVDEEILAEENSPSFIHKKKIWRSALEKAAGWLLRALDADGVWRHSAYVPGFVPSYYTRAVWGLLIANRRLQWPDLPGRMRQALWFYASRFREDGTVSDWGFRAGEPAFTHTLAYTLEGFLESALLLGEKEIVDQVVRSATILLRIRQERGKTAGRYGSHWAGDYSFRCLTGNAQLSVLFYRLWQITGEEPFRLGSYIFLREILEFQYLGKNPNRYGALPGSAPVWGPYLRFRYPNWGVKFFLDAMANWNNDVMTQ